MLLSELASAILWQTHAPISRIRFAKTIYFVHKELARQGIISLDSISYVRLPLGPVPEGFLAIPIDAPLIHSQPIAKIGLFYENEEFILTNYNIIPTFFNEHPNAEPVIAKTLQLLAARSLNELVLASHDPTWQSHPNGAIYHLSTSDLKNLFPYPQVKIKIRFKRPASNELSALQASLLRGMLHDIVRESTDLEHPDQDSTAAGKGNTPENPQNPDASSSFYQNLLKFSPFKPKKGNSK